MPPLTRKAMMVGVVGVVGILIAVATAGSGTAAANARSAFCSPHRMLQSFGGHPAQGFLAGLAHAPGVVRPGSYTAFRIVNEGTDELAEQAGWVQHWTGSSWIRMPEGPNPIFGAVAFVQPRSVSGCTGPRTGRRWRPGKYRYVVGIEAIEKSSKPTKPQKHRLRANFLLRRASR